MTYLTFKDSSNLDGKVVCRSTEGNTLKDPNIKDVVIPQTDENKNIVEIGVDAFKFSSIESVFIPKTVITVAGFSFSECPFLKKVTFEPGSCLKEFGEAVFCGCNSLKRIDLPPTAVSIGENSQYSFFERANLRCFSYLGTNDFSSSLHFFSNTPRIIHVSKYYPSTKFADQTVSKDDLACSIENIRCSSSNRRNDSLLFMHILLVFLS